MSSSTPLSFVVKYEILAERGSVFTEGRTEVGTGSWSIPLISGGAVTLIWVTVGAVDDEKAPRATPADVEYRPLLRVALRGTRLLEL